MILVFWGNNHSIFLKFLFLIERSKLSSTSNIDYNENSKDAPSSQSSTLGFSIDSQDTAGKSSSKYILSQSKKPSGTTVDKSKDTTNGTDHIDSDKLVSKVNGNNDSSSLDSELEMGVQLKEMRMELERREAEVKDLQVFLAQSRLYCKCSRINCIRYTQ